MRDYFNKKDNTGASRNNRTKNTMKWIGTAIGGIALLVVLSSSFSYVPVQHYGIVFNRFSGGYSEEVEDPGIIFHLPFAQRVYDVESNAHTLSLIGENLINVQTHDGQKLATEVDVQYRIPRDNAVDVFKYYQNNERSLRENIQYKLKPVVQRSIETVTTKYDVSQILGESRSKVEEEISQELAKELEGYELELTSFKLVSTDAEDGIEAAINAEAVAQQEVKTSKQQQEKQKVQNETKKQQIEAEAEQAKIKAEGQAEANRILSESLTPEIIDYEEVKARQSHGWVTTITQKAIVDTAD